MQREFRLHREVGVTLQGLLNAKPYNLYLQAMGFTENSQQESSIVKVVLQLGTCHSSVGNESACNAGNPGLIPRSGRSAGERIGYPLQYSWASLVVQLVKNLPAMQETWVLGKIP